jgi:histidyl-tRNA synthetase
MRDLETDEFAHISYVRNKFYETAELFNFKLMEPSPLEMLLTLETKSGAAISNEIYAFRDKGNRDIALRFDLTIGLTRYIVSRRDLKMPIKLAAFAGVWRYDEPQAGRYRYFHQWDIEIYGPFSHESDAEVIEFVSVFFKNLGLSVIIDVSDRQVIEEYIKTKLDISNEEEMLEMFRAIDKVPKKGADGVILEYKEKIQPSKLQALIELSKFKGDINQVANNQEIKDLVSWHKFTNLIDSLKARKVDNVRINLGIVRGLDYYSGVVFEAFDPLNDGGALVGGGRYDRLTAAFGRNDIGAIGVAGGVERIVLALQRQNILKQTQKSLVYLAFTSDNARNQLIGLASKLRNAGINVEYDLLGRALRKQLDDASTKGAALALIIASSEVDQGLITVRSMTDGTEGKYPLSGIVETLVKTFDIPTRRV